LFPLRSRFSAAGCASPHLLGLVAAALGFLRTTDRWVVIQLVPVEPGTLRAAPAAATSEQASEQAGLGFATAPAIATASARSTAPRRLTIVGFFPYFIEVHLAAARRSPALAPSPIVIVPHRLSSSGASVSFRKAAR
jgi:hypothetical protein